MNDDSGGEPMPVVRGYGVVVDGTGSARCVVRTLAWWRAAHRAFFEREGEQAGFVFHDKMEVVCERFAVVWPVPDVTLSR